MTDVEILTAAEKAAAKYFAGCADGKTSEMDSDEAATRAFWALCAPHTKQLLFRYHFAVCLLRFSQEDEAGASSG